MNAATELQLFLEDVCCDLCRFHHVRQDAVTPGEVAIHREFPLASEGAFADILVRCPKVSPYFVDVKYAYSPDRLLDSLQRKYGQSSGSDEIAKRLIVVTDQNTHTQLEAEMRSAISSTIAVEFWTDVELSDRFAETFQTALPSLLPADRAGIRLIVDAAKGRHAFGEDYADRPLDPCFSGILRSGTSAKYEIVAISLHQRCLLRAFTEMWSRSLQI